MRQDLIEDLQIQIVFSRNHIILNMALTLRRGEGCGFFITIMIMTLKKITQKYGSGIILTLKLFHFTPFT